MMMEANSELINDNQMETKIKNWYGTEKRNKKYFKSRTWLFYMFVHPQNIKRIFESFYCALTVRSIKHRVAF